MKNLATLGPMWEPQRENCVGSERKGVRFFQLAPYIILIAFLSMRLHFGNPNLAVLKLFRGSPTFELNLAFGDVCRSLEHELHADRGIGEAFMLILQAGGTHFFGGPLRGGKPPTPGKVPNGSNPRILGGGRQTPLASHTYEVAALYRHAAHDYARKLRVGADHFCFRPQRKRVLHAHSNSGNGSVFDEDGGRLDLAVGAGHTQFRLDDYTGPALDPAFRHVVLCYW